MSIGAATPKNFSDNPYFAQETKEIFTISRENYKTAEDAISQIRKYVEKLEEINKKWAYENDRPINTELANELNGLLNESKNKSVDEIFQTAQEKYDRANETLKKFPDSISFGDEEIPILNIE